MRSRMNFKFFARFFWGVASDKEKEQVYQSEESHQMMRKHWEEGKYYSSGERMPGDLFVQIQQEKGLEVRKVKSFQEFLMRIAAVVLIVVGLGSIVYLMVYQSQLLEPQVTYVEKSNPLGQRSLIILPDDSRVWLNADSKIRYPETFQGFERRHVELTGEGYFEIESKAEKPFHLETGDLTIRVKGTCFNVKAYPEEKQVETTLVEGQVVIMPASRVKEYVMKPGSQAVYSRLRHVLEVREGIDVQESIAWKDGKLVFNNDSFVQVARELERWYDIDIQIDEYLKGQHRFTMTITHESIKRVCELLSNAAPIRYRIEGGKLYFSPKTKDR